jgi:hypothetical protein
MPFLVRNAGGSLRQYYHFPCHTPSALLSRFLLFSVRKSYGRRVSAKKRARWMEIVDEHVFDVALRKACTKENPISDTEALMWASGRFVTTAEFYSVHSTCSK